MVNKDYLLTKNTTLSIPLPDIGWPNGLPDVLAIFSFVHSLPTLYTFLVICVLNHSSEYPCKPSWTTNGPQKGFCDVNFRGPFIEEHCNGGVGQSGMILYNW